MKRLAFVLVALAAAIALADDPSVVWRSRPNQGVQANCPSCNLQDNSGTFALVDAGTVNVSGSVITPALDAGVAFVSGALQGGSTVQFGSQSTNHGTLAGSTTGNPVTLTVDSSSGDTNAGISLVAKGTGAISTAAPLNLLNANNHVAAGSAWWFDGNSSQLNGIFYNSGATALDLRSAAASILENGFKVNSTGSAVGLLLKGTAAVTGASVTAGTCSNQGSAITITGAAAGDACILGLSASPGNGLAYSCVAGANTCQIVACNASAGALTSLTGTHTCWVIH